MKINIVFIFLLISQMVFAQTNDNKMVPNNHFFTQKNIGVQYLSNYTYNGRTDSLITPYLVPSFELYRNENLYLGTSLYYFLGDAESDPGFDFITIDGSYEYAISQKLSVGLFASRYIYNGSSYSIIGEINGTLGLNLSYSTKWIDLSFSTELLFNNGSDKRISLNLDKEFVFKNWTFSPNFNLNASSLHYFEGFESNKMTNRMGSGSLGRQAGGKKNRVPIISTTIESITTVNNVGIRLLNAEISAPIAYSINNIEITFSPFYVMPMNPISTTTEDFRINLNKSAISLKKYDSTPYSEKNLKNFFYWQIGVAINF